MMKNNKNIAYSINGAIAENEGCQIDGLFLCC